MPKNIFRVFNPNARPEDRAEKRRAQLRNAQQTYRERKDRYTKALEQELAVSRAREAHLLQENTRLKETIQSLKQGNECHSHSHSHQPGALQTSDYSTAPGASNIEGMDIPSSEFAAFDFDLNPSSSTAASWPDFASVSNSLCTTPHITQVTQALAASLSPMSSPSASASSYCVGDVDPTDIGMQFILMLEEPCIDHMHIPAKGLEATNLSNNHSLTVTSRLVDMGFTDNSAKAYQLQKEGKETRKIMQSMLDLSKDLLVPHSGTLTPVQAWQSVCSQPQFASLPVAAVQALAESLRKVVECHGFGSTIEQEVFQDQIAQALASVSYAKQR